MNLDRRFRMERAEDVLAHGHRLALRELHELAEIGLDSLLGTRLTVEEPFFKELFE